MTATSANAETATLALSDNANTTFLSIIIPSYRVVFENDFILRAGLHQANPVIGFGFKISVWKDYNIIWDYAVDPGMNREGISHNFSWRIEI